MKNAGKSKFKEILSDNSFLQSSIFDGKKVNDEFDLMCQQNDFAKTETIWTTINCFLLNKIFSEKRHNLLNSLN